MSAFAIVLIVIGALVLVLFVGGAIATARRTTRLDAELRRQVQEADRELARAKAEDRGWERETLETAARAAVLERFGGAQITALHLVQVLDRPGTDADQAVFRAQTPDGDHTVTLGRREGAWVAE